MADVLGPSPILLDIDVAEDHAANAPVAIRSADGLQVRKIDLRAMKGQWVELGTFRFQKGRKGSVAFSNQADGNVLADFTRSLYPPDGAWDFAAIGDDILGIVYERFLGNVVTVQKHQAVIEKKPEVRHATARACY